LLHLQLHRRAAPQAYRRFRPATLLPVAPGK
jgi:hypothetical protein